MIDILADRLSLRLRSPLPGNSAHLELSHRERLEYFSRYTVPPDAHVGSVLVMLYSDGDMVRFPLIQRTFDGHAHSGQISLPGGRVDPDDSGLDATALRETEEELGVDRSRITLLGRLSDIYIPPSNFLVHPFIGIYDGAPQFSPAPEEVDHVIEVPLKEFFAPESVRNKRITLRDGREIDTPAFCYRDYTVWGATAMMLNELKWLLKEPD
jgi:8-oxo-dGTP pyrophosphatase MutT (NUDIX family)